MSDKTSLELFNEARERGETIGDSIARMQQGVNENQLDAFSEERPQPVFLVLQLDGHKLGVTRLYGHDAFVSGWEFKAVCSCGASWSHKKDEMTRVMEAVFVSHVAYFTNRTTTL